MAPLSSCVTSQPRSPRCNIQLSLTRVNLAFFGQAVAALWPKGRGRYRRNPQGRSLSRQCVTEYFQDGFVLRGVTFVNPFNQANDQLIDELVLPRS